VGSVSGVLLFFFFVDCVPGRMSLRLPVFAGAVYAPMRTEV